MTSSGNTDVWQQFSSEIEGLTQAMRAYLEAQSRHWRSSDEAVAQAFRQSEIGLNQAQSNLSRSIEAAGYPGQLFNDIVAETDRRVFDEFQKRDTVTAFLPSDHVSRRPEDYATRKTRSRPAGFGPSSKA